MMGMKDMSILTCLCMQKKIYNARHTLRILHFSTVESANWHSHFGSQYGEFLENQATNYLKTQTQKMLNHTIKTCVQLCSQQNYFVIESENNPKCTSSTHMMRDIMLYNSHKYHKISWSNSNHTNGKTCMIRTLNLLRKKFKTSENGKISYSLGEV